MNAQRDDRQSDQHDDRFLTLEDACREFFGGVIGPAALRGEARRGNLTILKIGRHQFVTPDAIRARSIPFRPPRCPPHHRPRNAGSPERRLPC